MELCIYAERSGSRWLPKLSDIWRVKILRLFGELVLINKNCLVESTYDNKNARRVTFRKWSMNDF